MFEIGNSLREARTRRRIEFAQAEQATKIRGKYLHALEDEHFELLPSQTYVKGFLRTYADYLGLDGQLYVDEYNSRFVAGDDWDRPRVVRDTSERRVQRNAVLIAIGAIMVVTVIVISAWKTSGSGHTVPPVTKTPPVTHKAPVRHADLEISAIHGSSKVIVNRTDASGRTLFEGTLGHGGTPLAFNGTRFWLDLGSPENLVVKVDGRRVRLGSGRPWVLTVTPAGTHAAPA
ncbi:MAG TPA: helix-turn-helix domain-containing protein [Gaiellaceae bacterium]